VFASDSRGNSTVIPWDYDLTNEKNHALAAGALRTKMKWEGELIGGGFPNGDMVWVVANAPDRI
jgi:hypothetical protein